MPFLLILGLAGCGVLISLGLWQVDRMAWKQDILASIDARLAAEPSSLTVDVTEDTELNPVISGPPPVSTGG